MTTDDLRSGRIEEDEMVSPKLKIGLLLAGHVVAELLLAWATWEILAWPTRGITAFAGFPIHIVGLFALIFAEAGLIGVWGGLGAARLARRLPAVIAATVYLWAVLVMAMPTEGQRFSTFLIIALTAGTILVVLSGLRNSRRRLRLAHLANESPASEGFQFSIRHLLLATAAVAVVMAIGRGIRTITDRQWENTLAAAIFPSCFIMVDLATLWAALGIGRPTLRLAVVVPTAFVVGMLPMYYLEGMGLSGGRFVVWSAFVGFQAIIMAASLLVVRSCGWRLVRQAPASTDTAAVDLASKIHAGEG